MGLQIQKNSFIDNSPYLKKNRSDKKNHSDFIKPLNRNVQFRGLFNPIAARRTLNSLIPNTNSVISQKLEQKAQEILRRQSDKLSKLYTGFKEEFIGRLKENPEFRVKLGIDKKTMEAVYNGRAVSIPEPSIVRKFVNNLFAPLKIFPEIYSYVLDSRVGKWAKKHSSFAAKLVDKNSKNLEDARIIKNYRSYTGLIESIKIWEAKQRKLAGLNAWEETQPLLISSDVLEAKVMRRWLKSVNPSKGQYNIKHQMLGNRLISGMVYGIYLGNDAYNTTMRYSNSTEEANSQRKTRFAQEVAKTGINMYLTNFIAGMYEKYVNKSLFNSMLSSGAITMTTEILGRKLVGRPVFPSDKESLEKMSKEMEEKKGVWVGIGRLITGQKPKTNVNKTVKKKFIVLSDNRVPFGRKNQSQVSFGGGFFKTTNYMNAKTVKSLLDMIKEADPKIYKTYVEIINKSFKKMGIEKGLDTMLESGELIPLGTKKTIHGNIVKSFASPYFFIRDTGKKLFSGVKKLFSKNNTSSSLSQMKERLEELDKVSGGVKSEFAEFLKKAKASALWRESKLGKDAKETKILSEFLEALEKDTEEVEGVKNILLFLDKRMKSKDLTAENIEKMKKMLFDNFMKTDGAGLAEYDGNSFAMWNINLARVITTLFLVVDAYNLSIQYSNNDVKTAINNGKSRAMQEVSRISVSAYMLAFVHNLLSKFCNSSLFGAFTTTAITSSTNDAIARKVVGVPIGAKTYSELAKIDKENAKSKSPFKRALAYLIGKRNKNVPIQNTNNNRDFNLSITNSFKSMLD